MPCCMTKQEHLLSCLQHFLSRETIGKPVPCHSALLHKASKICFDKAFLLSFIHSSTELYGVLAMQHWTLGFVSILSIFYRDLKFPEFLSMHAQTLHTRVSFSPLMHESMGTRLLYMCHRHSSIFCPPS